LIEHQSTINPNMSIRLLFYIAKIYEKLVDNRKIYSQTKLIIPRPEFIVLYNGEDDSPLKAPCAFRNTLNIPEKMIQ
jgi:hypothetical protein